MNVVASHDPYRVPWSAIRSRAVVNPAQAGGHYYGQYSNGYIDQHNAYPGYTYSGYGHDYPGYGYGGGNCCRGLFSCCDRGYYSPAAQYVLVAPPPPPVIQNITNYNVIYVAPDKCAPEPLYDIDGQTIWSARAGCPQTR
jgi:hypothetical protein